MDQWDMRMASKRWLDAIARNRSRFLIVGTKRARGPASEPYRNLAA
jgi:hypothetical protein